jgi:hypothetical protein
MKFNWGTGIVIASLLFMSFIIVLVVKTYQHKVDLVSEDYYNQELHFQEKINKMNNAKAQSNKVLWQMNKKEIVFQFPKDTDSSMAGYIEFFRPSDSGKDLTFSIQLDADRKQHLPIEHLMHGLYKLKIDWTLNKKGYYIEEDIYIQ